MDSNTATFSGPIEAQQIKAASRILVYALPELVMAKFGSTNGVPMNTGDQIKFTYWEYFPVTGVPTIEGITPSSVPLVRKNVTLQLQQYGIWTPVTDWVVDLHPDNVMKPIMRNLGVWVGQTCEKLTCNALLAGLNVLYANNVTSRASVNGTVSRPMCARVKEIFRLNSAKMMTEMVGGSTKVGTVPIPPSWIAVVHPSLEDDIVHCVGFKPVQMYGNPNSILPNEIGSVDNIRFVSTIFLLPWAAAGTSGTTYRSNGQDTAVVGAGSADVYPILFLAEDAFATANLNNKKYGEVVLRRPGNAAPGDELGQTGSAGIKFFFGACILTDLYLVRGEVACTNPSKQVW